ncbi:zinc-binding dehydrogenase [Streptomyces sp. OE57]|uniref:zinc-binding dehydrogenase n=1 Tax=Streptomyces lacaronensis TaxID=3379885 RepID=UPI0039B7695E
MKAWRLETAGPSLRLLDVSDLTPRPGSVTIRIEACSVVSYLRQYVEGKLPGYNPPDGTFTPGTNGIGTIAEVGAQVYDLTPGQRVLTTGSVTAAENVPEPAVALLSMTAAPANAALLNDWPEGTLAEVAMAPVSVVTPIPAELDDVPSERLAVITRCLVPYGGLRRGRLEPGETVVVNGATGDFGQAAVYVALAMGAGKVVAAGRNRTVLDRLGKLDRVVPVGLTGDVDADAQALRAAAGGGADLGFDMIGGATDTAATESTLVALRRGGRLVLMGSARAPLPVDYTQLMMTNREIIGHFMYPAGAPAQLLKLAAGGLLDLEGIQIATFPLDQLDAAMDKAAESGGPLVVVQPN